MNFSWELVLYRLSGQDVANVFQTCRELYKISKREMFWSILMRRDFPRHHALCQGRSDFCPAKYEAWYKDLWKHGAYIFVERTFPLLPETPRSYFSIVSEKEGFTAVSYRFMKTRHLRNPDQTHIGFIRTNMIEKGYRKKLREGKIPGASGIDILNTYMMVSSMEELDPEYSRIRLINFRETRAFKVFSWILEHFEVSSMSFSTSRCCSFAASLKPGVVLSHKREFLSIYQTCGEGGGRTKSGPCKSKVLSDLIHRNPVHPNYGRCRKHPREPGDLSMYNRSSTNYDPSLHGNVFSLTDSRDIFSSSGGIGHIFNTVNDKMIPNFWK